MSTTFTQKLLSWYAGRDRNIPFRGVKDPYAVWVSEIMAQQTRIETVIPYFQKWFEKFPDVQTLASAKQQDVLKLWEGLGYYNRARNLHRAAQVVVSDFDGQLPSDVDALKSLPGIGDYTAGAIASLAFGRDEVALDGNIRRVLSRVFDIAEPLGTHAADQEFKNLAREYLPRGQAGDYNQALMDLGATVCKPRNPQCKECPVVEFCHAHTLGIQSQRPVRKEKSSSPHYIVAAAVIHRNGDVLIAQRAEDGLLGGMWEFPGGKQKPGEDLAACLEREICEELGVSVDVGEHLGVFEHAYSHFRVTLHAFHSTLRNGEPQPLEHTDLRWASPTQLADYPMGKIDRQIADTLIGHKTAQ